MPDSLNHRARARLVVLLIVGAGSAALRLAGSSVEQGSPVPQRLSIRQDEQAGTISVFRAGRLAADSHAERQAGSPGPICIRSPRPTARAC